MKKSFEWADILDDTELVELEDADALKEYKLTNDIMLVLNANEVKTGDSIGFIVEKKDMAIEGHYSSAENKLKFYDEAEITNDLQFKKFLQETFPKLLIEKINHIQLIDNINQI
ncbi:MAG: hypothetical protein CVV28_02140 [Methanobacteriales archaeon HGW-Methanobacteriales-1]|jgi:hypothetical protein|nr:MAG: hypothetical protein CVV28_02140 [Methanobacteriales archaeon HGW-Methanobacteriales-1]